MYADKVVLYIKLHI